MQPLAEILVKLPTATLDALAAVVGPVPGFEPGKKRIEKAKALFQLSARFRARVLVVDDISELFNLDASAAVFSILPRIASEAGRLGAVECARNWGDPRVKSWADWPPEDIAASLAMEIATTMDVPEKAQAYQRASSLVTAACRRVDSEPTERQTIELLAESPIGGDAKRLGRALRAALGEDATDVWSAVEASDGSLVLAVFLRRGLVSYPVVTKDRKVAVKSYRPVTVDLLRVSADGSRVALTLDEGWRLKQYTKALGLSLRPSFSIREIRPSTIDAFLARTPAGMRLEIDRLGFRFPDGGEVELDGPEAWNGANARDLWSCATLYQARFQVKDPHRRRFHIFLEEPHRIEMPEVLTYPYGRALLAALGVIDGGRVAGEARAAKKTAAAEKAKTTKAKTTKAKTTKATKRVRPARTLH